jgi:hypothetical protein
MRSHRSKAPFRLAGGANTGSARRANNTPTVALALYDIT